VSKALQADPIRVKIQAPCISFANFCSLRKSSMTTTRCGCWLALLASVFFVRCVTAHAQTQRSLSDDERQALQQGLQSLEQSVRSLADRKVEYAADVAIFQKGLSWALKYDTEFSPTDVGLLQKAARRGQERAEKLAASRIPWSTRRGRVVLGYVSSVDGSVQPYGLIVPKSYDPSRPMRLDVVLHGSSRPVGMSELRFMARFDEGDQENASPPDQPFLELHPLGRVENCYRWSGETDVFEAIDDVCRRYAIDRDRIVLRGMSMGASGTWHLGLKHPDRFVALGPYCGYVDTHHFSETPLDNFVKIGPLPEHQELGLHMLDSLDYAANAGTVPVVACMGEKDVFFQAHVLMGEAMRREGLTLVNLISPGTGHVIDPATHAEQMRRIGVYAARGINRQPSELRFVTWTLKYNRCHWLEVLGLQRHYARAEVRARLHDDILELDEPTNILQFAIRTALLMKAPTELRIGKQKLALPESVSANSPGVVVARDGTDWRVMGRLDEVRLTGKRPGLQGPIDDAFTNPFLCVRGTGQAWNSAAGAYADAALERFATDWHHYFRGELPVKEDTAVTKEDLRTRHLILFGDPGSNLWIARALPQLPLSWTKETLRLKGLEYASSNHVPALIVSNPLPGGEEHYLVLNSGHTFREAELAKLNYLLFPRWGDWAVVEFDPRQDRSVSLKEEIIRAGYFDEQWR
jgi:prolyl oligopeptidase family protein